MTTPGAPDASAPFTPQARHLAVVSGGSGDPSQTRMLAERMAESASAALSDTQRARLLSRLPAPVVRVVASEHRSQHRNRVAARERLVDLLREALAPPPPQRRPTRPTRGSKQRRLDAKKQRGRTKSLRGRVQDS